MLIQSFDEDKKGGIVSFSGINVEKMYNYRR